MGCPEPGRGWEGVELPSMRDEKRRERCDLGGGGNQIPIVRGSGALTLTSHQTQKGYRRDAGSLQLPCKGFSAAPASGLKEEKNRATAVPVTPGEVTAPLVYWQSHHPGKFTHVPLIWSQKAPALHLETHDLQTSCWVQL